MQRILHQLGIGLVAMACFIGSGSAFANEPALSCKLSGTAACNPEGICIGRGYLGADVTLEFDPETSRVALNGLEGVLRENLDGRLYADYRIFWRVVIVGYDYLSVRVFSEQTTIITLRDDRASLEFTCPTPVSD